MPCGLIIEKVNGIPCEKRLTEDESFADVRYLLEMCKQVSHSQPLLMHTCKQYYIVKQKAEVKMARLCARQRQRHIHCRVAACSYTTVSESSTIHVHRLLQC